ncbi:MAG: TRAP transporter substrate-binding protein [Syntrophothermus sp.]|uniref:TRAP transporter substrate-binding protein n=1 Tax=Syntrophothermus sp. TaxID=2736299 RepID=UPI00257C9C5C|nr:TRAP transporter substrate-binding protein [Syntrophothermus sp.]NSW84332.1 TRAP transporter substrate-binding protein [Syntrophothermus sp.]
MLGRWTAGLLIALALVLCLGETIVADATIVLKYGHPNAPASIAGRQADLFAKLVAEKTGNRIRIQVYPASQLGTLSELVEATKIGSIDISHNTYAGISTLYEDFAVFDTPYLFDSPEHLMKTVAPDSPLMKQFNEKLIARAGVRVLYSFYLGTRHLTANRPVYSTADLKGVKIRSIPFPIYTATVEGMGAIATPIDFAELPSALATGIVSGQENPLDIIWAQKFYETQKYLIMTGHIIGADGVIINERSWQRLSPELQSLILEAARETAATALEWNLTVEAELVDKLRQAGMTVIDEKSGLRLDEIKKRVKDAVERRFGSQWNKYWSQIAKMGK